MSELPTPTLSAVLAKAMAGKVSEIHVAIPARVESYDSVKRAINAQPLLRRGYTDESGDRATERMPVITDVPVVFPGSGGVRIKFPISVGDTVLLLFSEASLDRWLVRGGEIDPADDRQHSLSDAIAIPGLADFAHVGDASPMIEFTGSEIRAGGSSALVTRAEFMAHVHATAGTGPPSTPTVSITGTTILKGA